MNKEIFKENLSKIAPGMSQKEIARIMEVKEGTVSKYLNLKEQAFPNVDCLMKLSQHFNVSIDWLVGNTVENKAEENLSPRDICKILVRLSEAGNRDVKFKTITASEECVTPPDEYGSCSIVTRNNKYSALYFSNWYSIPEDYEERYVIEQLGNDNGDNSKINIFLNRYLQIKDMLKNNMLPQDMYDRLLESYLTEVPDTTK